MFRIARHFLHLRAPDRRLLSGLLGAFLLAVLSYSSASADTNDVLEAESSIRLPSFEANIYYSSMKIERGAIENPESVFGYGEF